MTYESLFFVLVTLISVALGYVMGRNSAGQPVSSQPKKFDPGPAENDFDPYADALVPENPVGKRIPTV